MSDPLDGLQDLIAGYGLDRTEGQEFSVFIGVEKNALSEQLWSWFGGYGVPVIALGGYSSQSYVDDVASFAARDGRKAVLLYGGDFDPSGEDIDRDFEERTGCFDEFVRVALNAEQVDEYNLPPAMGKSTDARAGAFVARHGQLVQVELDALPPDTFRQLYLDAFEMYWDSSVFESVLDEEERGQAKLERLVEVLEEIEDETGDAE